MNKKNILLLIVCFLLSAVIVLGYPLLARQFEEVALDLDIQNVIDQKVVAYGDKEISYNKLYNGGQLVGVITSLDDFNDYILQEYQIYEEQFPNTKLGLSDDLYIVPESSFNIFENRDREIVQYLVDQDLLGIRTTAIELSTSSGVFDIIYVNDLDMFYKARDQFLLNFIDEDVLNSLRAGESIQEPVDFGIYDMGLSIVEKMTFTEACMPPDQIYTSVKEIYDYLCYGRNTDRQYYTTVEGDTLYGVGYRFQNMSPKQLMMLNPDVIFSTDQVLEPNMTLNVTYFSSPLTVQVIKNRLSQEVVNPDNPQYIHDSSVESGVVRVDVEEVNGLENVLYEEVWINGVLVSGSKKSSVIVREPVQGVITIGAQKVVDYGTGNYIWPVDNPVITCIWGCYAGHTGTDIVNRYERYGPVYASDTGVVEIASYHSINGNYVVIDHQNGVKTYYGHMSQMYVQPGQTVQRGEVIGQIGMTGVATGPHVHFHFIVDGVISNACNYMNCYSIPWS